MKKYSVTAAGYYYGENYPAVIMECAVYWAYSRRQVRQDFVRKIKEYDINVNKVNVDIRQRLIRPAL